MKSVADRYGLGILIALLSLNSFAENGFVSHLAGERLTAADIAALPFQTGEAGPHHRERFATDADGNVVSHYVEMATGLMRQDDTTGQWVESSVDIELFEGGAISRKTAYQLILSPSSDDPNGVFDLLLPAEEPGAIRERFRGNCIGIAMTSKKTGRSVWLAEMKGVGGQAGNDEVIYPECFQGERGFAASLRMKLTLAGVAQDVVIHTALPEPREMEFLDDPSDISIEVWTRILDAPPAQMVKRDVPLADGKVAQDTDIDFGSMRLDRGAAFPLEPELPNRIAALANSIPVTKEYVNIQGSQFLIESVEYNQAAPQLAKLRPLAAKAGASRRANGMASATGRRDLASQMSSANSSMDGTVSVEEVGERVAPERRGSTRAVQNVAKRGLPISLASSGGSPRTEASALRMTRKPERSEKQLALNGYVLDFDLNAGNQTNLVLKSDATYFVTGVVNIYGALSVEGGVVCKFKDNTTALVFYGTALEMKTDAYNPAWFIAKDDDTLGATISGSSGTPTGYYGYPPLAYLSSTPANISHIRARDATWGIYFYQATGSNVVSHSQFVRCSQAVVLNSSTLHLRNALLYNSGYALTGVGCTLRGEHLTVDTASQLLLDYGGTALTLTNTVFSNAGSMPWSFTGDHNVTNNVATNVFQQAGAGKHYFTDTHRSTNTGTTNINPTLATELAQMTTFPPILITNDFTADTTLSPFLTKDTYTPGYHYARLDYLWGERNVTNATLILTNGVIVGNYGTNGTILRNGSKFYSTGRPNALNTLVRYATVQEDWSLGATTPTTMSLVNVAAPSSDPEVQFRFTRANLLANTTSRRYLVYGYTGNELIQNHTIRDCQLLNTHHNHSTTSAGGSAIDFFNNLFFRPTISFFQATGGYYPFPVTFRNNLVRNGTVTFSYSDTNSVWTVTDNVFDTVSLSGGTYSVAASTNGYCSTTSLGGSGNKTLSSPLDFQKGALGSYYYPTNGGNLSTLTNAGSRNATNAGLFHYTTQTNNTKEGSTLVDIGFHYVATDSNGNPIDSDGDSLPDYLEDTTGNGTYETTSDYSNWNDANDPWILGWGGSDRGQFITPSGLGGAMAFDGGLFHTVALYPNGSVRAWGDNTYGKTNIPAALTGGIPVVAISAAWEQSAAVLADGRVITWPLTNAIPAPTNITDAVSVALGWKHGLVLRRNGTTATWGATNSSASTNLPGLTGVKAIAAGWQHNVALLWDGTVRVWGASTLGTNWWITNTSGLNNVVAIAAGGYHTVALKVDGTVAAWGAGNTNGSASNYFVGEFGQAKVPSALTNPATANVVAIAAGGYSSLALRRDGTVVTWGEFTDTPVGISNIVAVAAGDGHCLVSRIGGQTPLITVQPESICPGIATAGRFEVKAIGPSLTYKWYLNGNEIFGANGSAYQINNVQATNVGTYHAVVSNAAGSVASQSATLTIGYPLELNVSPTNSSFKLLYGQELNLSVSPTNVSGCGTITYTWTLNGEPVPTLTGTNYQVKIANNNDAGTYLVSATNSAGLTTNSWTIDVAGEGSVVQWGDWESTWQKVAGITNAIGLAVGETHNLLLKEDGSVYAWNSIMGDNGYHQTNVPSSATNVVAIAAGSFHNLALRADGSVIAWGDNGVNQTNVPTDATNIVAISAGLATSLALRNDGRVVPFGFTNAPAPNLTNVTSIASGADFHVAGLANGTVVAWGLNGFNQTNVPASATNVLSVAAGRYHALALRSNGTVIAWGRTNEGQTKVPGILTNPSTANVMSLAGGYGHSMALRNDGTVITWGANTASQTNTPSALTNVKLIASGGNRSFVAINSSWLNYSFDAAKDLLLIYNTNSANSKSVMEYYRQHRPLASNANVLALSCPPQETISPLDFTNSIRSTVLNWWTNNPTKRPQYWILFLDVPSRVNAYTTNYFGGGGDRRNYPYSVSYQLSEMFPQKPYVTHINMNGTNDCKGYIDKLEFFGTNYSPGGLLISAGKYTNGTYVLDNIRHQTGYGMPHIKADGTTNVYDFNYSSYGWVISSATNALVSVGVSANAIWYSDGPETLSITNDVLYPHNLSHPTSAANVAGYISWGAHSSLDNSYATNGALQWSGASRWWIIETIESFNGQRENTAQGNFLQWFASNAFGGGSFSNTPVGAVSHVDEPGDPSSVNNPSAYFSLWATGKNFGICAWKSRSTPWFQAVGDPLVKK